MSYYPIYWDALVFDVRRGIWFEARSSPVPGVQQTFTPVPGALQQQLEDSFPQLIII